MRAVTTRSVADLVRAARDRGASLHAQHAAFTALVERFEAMAFATALRLAGDPEAARDVCQEAFLAAWRSLPALREPAAFGGWLKRLVRTHAGRARRRLGPEDRARAAAEGPLPVHDPLELAARGQEARLVRDAVLSLPERERVAIVRFYFLGEPLRAIARDMGVTVGRAGKSLYTARLRLRRTLPRGVAAAFLGGAPAPAFTRRVRAGMLDELVGDYRFAARPRHVVSIRRFGDRLVSLGGGQRNVLGSRSPDTLAATEFDGEARFLRDRTGRVRRLVYYEFGRRMGVAERLPSPRIDSSSRRFTSGHSSSRML